MPSRCEPDRHHGCPPEWALEGRCICRGDPHDPTFTSSRYSGARAVAEVVTFRAPPTYKERIKERAEAEHTSENQVIRDALDAYLSAAEEVADAARPKRLPERFAEDCCGPSTSDFACSEAWSVPCRAAVVQRDLSSVTTFSFPGLRQSEVGYRPTAPADEHCWTTLDEQGARQRRGASRLTPMVTPCRCVPSRQRLPSAVVVTGLA